MLAPEDLEWLGSFALSVNSLAQSRTAGLIGHDEAHAKLMDILRSCTRHQIRVLSQIIGMVAQSGLMGAFTLPPEVIDLIQQASTQESETIQ